MQDAVNHLSKRVLFVPRTPRDGAITTRLLAREGIDSLLCQNVAELARELENGAGAVLLTEDALSCVGLEKLMALIDHQPPWSDLPVLVLMPGAKESDQGGSALARLGNVTLLERPVAMRSLLSALHAAIRGRSRQYEARQLILSERAARSAAERADRMKDDFLATLSHELRTPLNAILGWSQLLIARKDLDPELEEGLAVVARNTRLQTQLVEDLLDMSRIVSGKIRLETQQLDVRDVIDAAVGSVRQSADAKQIRLEATLPAVAIILNGDPSRLQQCFSNLLSNAIKFTPRGGAIRITAERANDQLKVSVIDNGIGIAKQFFPFIFERFRQADSSSVRQYGGLGLGLSIVKHLVELHGGNIFAESEGEGKGATFIVMLPLPRERDSEVEAADHSGKDFGARQSPLPLKGMRVLAVDDEPDSRRLLKRILEQGGAHVMLASSAQEAFELLQREHPDLILSDIGMPGEDGYDLMKRIRELPHEQGGQIPAAALTAFARAEDRSRAIAAGYQRHIPKPVDPAALLSAVADLASVT